MKRGIGDRCHDEPKPSHPGGGDGHSQASVPPTSAPPEALGQEAVSSVAPETNLNPTWNLLDPFGYQSETLGNEFAVLTDFLETLGNDDAFFNPTVAPSLTNSGFLDHPMPLPPRHIGSAAVENAHSTLPTVIPAATKTERFLLTAADQESGSRDQRLKKVIQSKYEAGLLKPYK